MLFGRLQPHICLGFRIRLALLHFQFLLAPVLYLRDRERRFYTQSIMQRTAAASRILSGLLEASNPSYTVEKQHTHAESEASTNHAVPFHVVQPPLDRCSAVTSICLSASVVPVAHTVLACWHDVLQASKTQSPSRAAMETENCYCYCRSCLVLLPLRQSSYNNITKNRPTSCLTKDTKNSSVC